MNKIIATYYDPNDADRATNKGSMLFKDEDSFLDWLNNYIKNRPRLEVKAYYIKAEVELESVYVTTKYLIK